MLRPAIRTSSRPSLDPFSGVARGWAPEIAYAKAARKRAQHQRGGAAGGAAAARAVSRCRARSGGGRTRAMVARTNNSEPITTPSTQYRSRRHAALVAVFVIGAPSTDCPPGAPDCTTSGPLTAAVAAGRSASARRANSAVNARRTARSDPAASVSGRCGFRCARKASANGCLPV